MRRSELLLSLAALTFLGCAPYSRQGVENDYGSIASYEIDANRCLDRALALEKVGNHLESGIYFEAALRYGGEEERILPLLVAAQVRSGQLRAAQKNVSRLLEIKEDQPYVEELQNLLAKLVAQSDGHSPHEEAQ
jgi:tetratricopeptide (TPR) repeat protein